MIQARFLDGHGREPEEILLLVVQLMILLPGLVYPFTSVADDKDLPRPSP